MSSPSDLGVGTEPLLSLLARLAKPERRAAAARDLAARLGAEDLIVLVEDPEVGEFLPAAGFPQTLPRGGEWRSFFQSCRHETYFEGSLPVPGAERSVAALGVRTEDVLLVLLAGNPDRAAIEAIVELLPLLGGTIHGEREAQTAAVQTGLAREAAARERALARSLDAARRQVQEALVAARQQVETESVLNTALRQTAQERDRAQAEAQAERQRLRDLFMQAPAVIAVLRGREHVFELANSMYLALVGRHSESQLLGKSLLEALPELAGQGFVERLDRVYASGEPFLGRELPAMFDRKGTGELEKLFLNFVYQASRDAQGEVDGILVHAVDVSDEILAREREARFARHALLRAEVAAALTGDAPLGEVLQKCAEALVTHLEAAFARIWTLDDQEQMLELQASAGMYTHLDGSHSRVPVGALKIGLIAQERRAHLTNDVPNDPRVSDKEWARREGMLGFAGYPLVVEDRLVGVVALFSRSPIDRDTLAALEPIASVLALGIERVRTELSLRVREAQFRTLVEHLPVGVIMAEAPSGHIVLANEAVQRILRQSTPTPADTSAYARVERFHLDGKPLLPEDWPLTRSLTHGETVTAERSAFVRGDGTRGIIAVSSAPIKDRDEKIIAAVVVFEDVTDQEELGRQKDQFLSAAAHDLKTPLTAIQGLAQLLRIRIGRLALPQSEKTIETLGFIESATRKSTRLINELLDVARSDATGSIELQTRETNLVELVERVVGEQQREAQRHELRFVASAPRLVARCDPDRLERALINLIGNAVKYSPDGGEVVIRIDTDAAAAAVISVSDQGMGIPTEDQARIFERFERGSNVRDQIAGSGVGLNYVRDIVARHGGTIGAESEVGKGSTFTLRLPLGV